MAELKSYELEKKIFTAPACIWNYPALLLLGEEAFLKEELIEHITQKLNLAKNSGFEKIDADIAKDDDIFYALETSSFDDFKKIIVIYNADKIKADTCKKIYELWDKNGFPESALPIFCADKVDGRRAFWQLVKEEGIWAKFWKLFEDRLVTWTSQRLQMARIKTQGLVAEEIVALCGNDLKKIAREISKLALVYESSTINIDTIKKMVTKSTEASKFDIEDAFMMRDLKSLFYLMDELEDVVDVKSVVLSLIRLCRHAAQARYYLNRRDSYAIQLADLGQQIYQCSKVKDWANISKRISLLQVASGVADRVPMADKMIWTGTRPLFPDEQDKEQEQEVESAVDEPEIAKGKKRKKALNFDINAETKKSTEQLNKKRLQDEAYDLYSYNVWAQKNSLPIAKAFTIAAKYNDQELLNLLTQLSKAYYSIWVGEEYLLRSKLDTILLSCIKTKGE